MHETFIRLSRGVIAKIVKALQESARQINLILNYEMSFQQLNIYKKDITKTVKTNKYFHKEREVFVQPCINKLSNT